MKKIILILVLTFAFAKSERAECLAPGWAATFSILPGLGQMVTGRPGQGAAWAGTVWGLLLSGNPIASQIGFDLWMYNIYNAYQGAGAKDVGDETVFENWVGAVNWANIADPIGASVVGTAAVVGSIRGINLGYLLIAPAIYSFVGLGEEGLFRGVLYPGISHVFWDSKWTGAILSSALFSAAHMISGEASDRSAFALGFRFIFGMLLAWQETRNDYDMRKNIFAHCWWDVFISMSEIKAKAKDPQYRNDSLKDIHWKQMYKDQPIGASFNFAF